MKITIGNYYLIADKREKNTIDSIRNYHRQVEFATLPVGDYACSCGCTGFERKEADADNLKRTLTQTSELLTAYPHAFLVINRSADDFLIFSTGARTAFIASCMVRGLGPPLFVKDYYSMLDIIYRTIDKFHDGKTRGPGEFIHQRHVTLKDRQLNLLTSLPGISKRKAERILERFGTPFNFLTASPKEMTGVEGLGRKGIKNIMEVLDEQKK